MDKRQLDLNDILTHPNNMFIKDIKNGGIKIYAPDGRGVFIRNDGTFRGFIEQPGKDGKYTTHNEDGTFKQYRGKGKPHGDVPRPNVKENKIDPKSPDGRPSKSTVRPAEPDEIPGGP